VLKIQPRWLTNGAIALVIATGTAGVNADEKKPETGIMNGEQIEALLNDANVYGTKDGRDWSQTFNRDGTTSFSFSRGIDRGHWRVTNDLYCSSWPPSERWECWRVEHRGTGFAFVSEKNGDEWTAAKR